MEAPPERPQVGFTSELGLRVDLGEHADTLTGHATISPELCIPEAGVLRPSVLLTWADILAGSLANERTLPKICMTVDLSVRIATPIPAGADVTVLGHILKAGRTLTFAEAIFTIAGTDTVAAVALGTFVASPRPQDVATSAFGAVTSRARVSTAPAPITEMLGSIAVAPGVVDVPRSERILNWADTVQGGAVAAAAEEAVLALDEPPVPNELDVRYLASVRAGPMRATATRFGSWVRVEVRDLGNDDRLAALASARGA